MELPELYKKLFSGHPVVKELLKLNTPEKGSNIQLKGLNGSSKSLLLSAFFQESGRFLLCLSNDAEDAGYLYHDFCQILGEENVFFFPSAYRRAIKYGQKDAAQEIARTEVLCHLEASDSPVLIVTYPDALSEKVASKEALQARNLTVSKNERIDSYAVAEILDGLGFEEVEYVYEPGQYALRGSILDVYSFSNEYPYRIDFFGDEIESIRSFEVETQLSREQLESVQIVAAIDQSEGDSLSLLDYLPDETIIPIWDPVWCGERFHAVYNDHAAQFHQDETPTQEEIQRLLVKPEQLLKSIRKRPLLLMGSRGNESVTATVEANTTAQPLCHKNFDLISQQFGEYLAKGYELFILSDTVKQTERIKTIFEDRGDKLPFIPVLKTLHEGFADNMLKACFFTDHQIFDRFHKYNLKSDKARSGKISLSLKELNQFSIGDYVVHIDHGVGKFGGLLRTEVNGSMQEVIKLLYQNDDVILVSIHSLHKLSKYKGKEGEPPRISKLGSGAWERMKEKTKKRVKDIARDLILLYSKRRQEKGFAFSPDSYLQQELEASFLYEDTPDQLKSCMDVKSDMEREIPMDRLICGDVGFGKTEIAIRAAFKAVTDSKQVAVLVPTTVLAYQHFQTFTSRLKDFPCKIDYLSRARTGKETKEILKSLAEGKIDILIGTHRLVGNDVHFKDLGLLIIDEEQKFGVSTKEKLKRLKVNVDTLTLSATPIPRTLQFSLMGARDFSTITTPPPNRYPIQTEVHRFGEEIIREAIQFEMSRNGQLFFINNRIQNIYELEAFVKRTVPEARVAVGHGQMAPEVLEQLIIDFSNYEYDVLIATSIVESGIDIPNVNTIIIQNAQQFGLSDLHQLRGRVGRSNRKAFCYLLTPPLNLLTPEARRRLQAIENFSDLGSGIHIAMQDLDIRGAGNLLGAEQSGFIADLGYEAYQRILEEAVLELKEEEFASLFENSPEDEENRTFVHETQIESDLELLFPPTYIPNDSERIGLYRELDKIETDAQLKPFVAQLKDRFGKIPPQGQELIRVVELKRRGKKLGIERLLLKNGNLSIHTVSNENSPYYQSKSFDRLLTFVGSHPQECKVKETKGKLMITVRNIKSVEAAIDLLKSI
ncbi:MAG: transcription-repair coupling factor [Bacteroidales bacterium]|nr:transcription-repair coupling factor [Bacteroidales bacterium]